MDTGVIEGGLNVTLTIRLLMHGKVRVRGTRGRTEAPSPDTGVALPAARMESERFHGSKSVSVGPLGAASLLQPLGSGVRNVLLGIRPAPGYLMTNEAAL